MTSSIALSQTPRRPFPYFLLHDCPERVKIPSYSLVSRFSTFQGLSMSSLPSSSFTNASGEGQADQSTPNTLTKDPPTYSQPVPAVSKSKLVKPRATAEENEGVSESQPSIQPPSGSISKTNRLRKALGVGPSSIQGPRNTDSNQSNGGALNFHETRKICSILIHCFVIFFRALHSPLHYQSPTLIAPIHPLTLDEELEQPPDPIAKGNLISFLRNAVSSAAEFGCGPLF
jgi:hypothetical protein